MQSKNDNQATDVSIREATRGNTGDDSGVQAGTAVAGQLPAEQGDLGLDQVFEILKNQRRRYLLQYLWERDEPVSLSDLSEQIAAWENGKEVRAITSSERKRVYVGLYQCHLPKMDGMDVVDFNKPRGIIESGENIEMFDSYLDAPTDAAASEFSKYYLGLSALSLVGLGIAVLTELMLGVPAIGVASAVVVLSFAATTLFYHRSEQESENRIGTPDVEG